MRPEDFERLFSEHAKPLFAFLVYRCGDRGLAEDLLADTFERALRARRRFDRRKASEKTWLYSIALNRLRDELRHRGAEQRAVERAAAQVELAGDDFARVAARDELRSALDALSEEEREVIALRFGAELTVPEIARITGQPTTTSEGRLYRALRRMRDQLAPADELASPPAATPANPAGRSGRRRRAAQRPVKAG
jgi:RNA polymerase sigma-70 factor, ECF subfamily